MNYKTITNKRGNNIFFSLTMKTWESLILINNCNSMPSLNLHRLACENTHSSSAKMFKKHHKKNPENQTKLFLYIYTHVIRKQETPLPVRVDRRRITSKIRFCCRIWYWAKQNGVWLFIIFSLFPFPTDYYHDIPITNLTFFQLFFLPVVFPNAVSLFL